MMTAGPMTAGPTFAWHSQAGQDNWAFSTLDLRKPGTFLDVGCGDPIRNNNTYTLEQLGWRGMLLDESEMACSLCRQIRKGIVVCADARVVDWPTTLSGIKRVDYLSLDCDGDSLEALRNLLDHDVRFRSATIEHDAYRFGDGPRAEMRRLLTAAGYKLAVADVCCSGFPQNPFEDWWTAPDV